MTPEQLRMSRWCVALWDTCHDVEEKHVLLVVLQTKKRKHCKVHFMNSAWLQPTKPADSVEAAFQNLAFHHICG